MTAQDRREFVRRPVDIPVELSVQGRFYDGLIKNMRNGGVFIETKGRFSDKIFQWPLNPQARREPAKLPGSPRKVSVWNSTTLDTPDKIHRNERQLSACRGFARFINGSMKDL